NFRRTVLYFLPPPPLLIGHTHSLDIVVVPNFRNSFAIASSTRVHPEKKTPSASFIGLLYSRALCCSANLLGPITKKRLAHTTPTSSSSSPSCYYRQPVVPIGTARHFTRTLWRSH